MKRFLKEEPREEPDISIVKSEFDEISDVYLNKNVNSGCTTYYHMKNKNDTDNLIPKNQITWQSLCLSCENQYNAAMKNSMIYKPRTNDSECILPYSFVWEQLNNTVSRDEFTRKMNQIAVSLPKFNFGNHFMNVELKDKLDLSFILTNDVARAIYYQGMCNGYKMYQKNKFKSEKIIQEKCTIQNHKQNSSNNIVKTNKLKLKQNIDVGIPLTQSTTINSQIKSFEINEQETTLKTLNNSFKPQFSIVDESYVPVPALQLFIGSELPNTKCKLDVCSNKNKDNHELLTNKKPTKRRKVQSSKTTNLNKKCKVHDTNGLQNDFIKTDKMKFTDLSPIIPLSVLDYMNELEFTHKI